MFSAKSIYSMYSVVGFYNELRHDRIAIIGSQLFVYVRAFGLVHNFDLNLKNVAACL